jgi:hypothetical protein
MTPQNLWRLAELKRLAARLIQAPDLPSADRIIGEMKYIETLAPPRAAVRVIEGGASRCP